jgi:hypothetical protein
MYCTGNFQYDARFSARADDDQVRNVLSLRGTSTKQSMESSVEGTGAPMLIGGGPALGTDVKRLAGA